jgi:hypothetical protein
MVMCRSCYAQRPRILRKRSHQAFTDMEAEQPLSPVLRPPHQEMGSGDSESDGDEVMGTGDTSSSDKVTACMCTAHSRHIQGDKSQQHTHAQVCLNTCCGNTCYSMLREGTQGTEVTSVGYGWRKNPASRQKRCNSLSNQLLHHPYLADVTSLHRVTSLLPVHATYTWHAVSCICILLLHVTYTGDMLALTVSTCSW